MPTTPTCLFMPLKLREKHPARFGWSTVAGATRYRLECIYDETFDHASKGFTWSAIEGKGKTWQGMEAAQLCWNDIEALPTDLPPDCFVVWEGLGEAVSEPDRGLMWYQMDNRLSWQTLEAKGTDWQQFEGQTGRGHQWHSLDARYLTWSARDAVALAWQDIEWLPADSGDNMYTTLTIPLYGQQVSCRVSSSDGGAWSPCTTSTPQAVLPLFYRGGTVSLAVTAGGQYTVQLFATGIVDWVDVILRLRYNGYLLDYIKLCADADNPMADTALPMPNATVMAQQQSELSLVCTRQISQDSAWSGLLCAVRFVARHSGTASFTLQ